MPDYLRIKTKGRPIVVLLTPVEADQLRDMALTYKVTQADLVRQLVRQEYKYSFMRHLRK